MKQGTQRIVLTAVYCAALLVGGIAMYFLMNYCLSANTLFPIAGMAMLACAAGLCIVNVIVKKKLYKKFSDENAAEMMKLADSMREEALKDYLATEKALIKSKNLLILYKVLLSLYFLAVLCVSAVGTSKSNPLRIPAIVTALVGVFLYPVPLLDFALGSRNVKAPENCLERAQYPLIFSVADKAKKTLNCDRPYKIVMTVGDGISVSAYTGGFYVSLNVEEAAILTKDELYQIMLHEIAHVMNSDTKRTWRLEKFASQVTDTRLGSFVTSLFFPAQFINFMLKKEAYYTFCTLFYEMKADQAVKEFGDGQVYINGTAKAMTFSMYEEEFNPEMKFYIHKSETLPQDYLFQDVAVYERYWETYGEKWNFLLTHRIPSRVDTHPTFSMRMEAMGTSEYDCRQKETDEKYIAEQQRLLKAGCKRLAENTSEDFAQARKEYYLPTLEKIEKYKKAKESQTKLSVVEKTEYIELFYNIDRGECLKLCNEVLAVFPRNAYANMYKGFILAQNLDKSCVEHLYIAGEENMNFAHSAYNAIGVFACNVGDEELLASYRERIESDTLDAIKRQREASVISADQGVRANSLPKQDFDNVLGFILEKGKDVVSAIYSVSRGEGADMRTFYYIETYKSAKREDVGKFFDEVFEYLDMYVDENGEEPDFSLWSEYCDKNMKKLIKSTQGALIYSSPEIKR